MDNSNRMLKIANGDIHFVLWIVLSGCEALCCRPPHFLFPRTNRLMVKVMICSGSYKIDMNYQTKRFYVFEGRFFLLLFVDI